MCFFLEKNYKRQLYIIQQLISNEKGISIRELAGKNNVVIKTCRQDMQNIQEFLPEGWNITHQKKFDIYCIKKPSEANFQDVYAVYLRKSLFYKLITITLKNKKPSLIQLSESFYISHSNMYKKISGINDMLKKIGLYYDTSTLTLHGDELQLRMVIYDLICKGQSPKDFGITFQMINDAKKIILYIERCTGFKFAIGIRKTIEYWIAICQIRRRNNCLYRGTLEENPIALYIQQYVTKYSYKNKSNWLGITNKNLEFYILSLGFYINPFPYTNENLDNAIRFYQKKGPVLFDIATKLIEGGNLDESVFTRKELVMNLIDTFVSLPLVRARSRICPSFFCAKDLYEHLIIEDMKKQLQNALEKNSYHFCNYDRELLVKFFYFTYGVTYRNKAELIKPITIKIIHSSSKLFAKNIARQIEQRYHGLIEIQRNEKETAEIIVSDLPKSSFDEHDTIGSYFFCWIEEKLVFNLQQLDNVLLKVIRNRKRTNK